MDINRPYFGQEPVHEGKIAVHGREFVFTEWILAGNYGMRVWPCSVILSEELAKEKWNKVSVCELGAGLGLPGMLLSTLGADVTFIEKDRICCDWLKMTLYHNKVNGKVVFCDWSEYNGDTFDSIVGSEIVYIDEEGNPSEIKVSVVGWEDTKRFVDYLLEKNPDMLTELQNELPRIEESAKKLGYLPPLFKYLREKYPPKGGL
jgi:hypothetical protein